MGNALPEPNIAAFEIYIDWFFELNTCRQAGMGLSSISFTDIHYFATIKGIEEFDDFLYLMRKLDQKYMEKSDKNGTTNAS